MLTFDALTLEVGEWAMWLLRCKRAKCQHYLVLQNGQSDGEYASLAYLADYLDRSSVSLDNLLDKCQA